MGIYDQGLANYQHGIDTAIQLQGQPMTLAQSILGGFNAGQQQGFGNRMQTEHLNLQRDQLAEQARHRQMQEEQARQNAEMLGQYRGGMLQEKAADRTRKEEHGKESLRIKDFLATAQGNRLAKQNGLTDAQIEHLQNIDLNMEELRPFREAVMKSQEWKNYNPSDTVSFGSGSSTSGRSLAAFDSAVSRHMKEENDRRQAQNANIIRGKNIMTGQAAEPQPLMTRAEAEDAVTQGWERLSAKGSENKGIDIQGGGPALKKPGSAPEKPSGASFIKAKAKGVGAAGGPDKRALRAQAASAISAGKDASLVKSRYKEMTGEDY